MSTTSTPANRVARRTVGVLVIAMLVLLGLVLTRAGGPASPDAQDRLEIVMDDDAFEPAELSLPVGTPIGLVFINRDDTVHHVSFGRQVIEENGARIGFAEDVFADAPVRIEPSRARIGPSEQFPTVTIQVEPGSSASLRTELPAEAAGSWQMGCFTARGCHFRTGLAGEVTVE